MEPEVEKRSREDSCNLLGNNGSKLIRSASSDDDFATASECTETSSVRGSPPLSSCYDEMFSKFRNESGQTSEELYTNIVQEIKETRRIKFSPQGCFETITTTYHETDGKKGEPQVFLKPLDNRRFVLPELDFQSMPEIKPLSSDNQVIDNSSIEILEAGGNIESKDLLELKILELVPDLTLLGETFEEASELEIAHNHVMKQLQNKQSPVEELLKKADQVIADKKPRAEVYAAMADSLGQAWTDIHSHLTLRKHILHLNVTYHSKAEACMERMNALELLCLSPIPHNEDMVKESLECMQEIKKSMLECLMGSLKSGQNLLSALNEVANESTIDSRPGRIRKCALTAIAQVEQWMEQLHNRRRLLDVTWQRRKHNLEKYRTLAILKCDLELLEGLLKERYELLSSSRDELGDSAASAELLLQEHRKMIPEATNLQEEGLRMVKASEQLPSSAHKFSQESNRMSYGVLNIANEYMQAINDREDLLEKCILFFKSAKSVMMKLEEMDYQLKNVNSISERLIIMNMTEDISKDVITDGHWILERAPGAKGVRRTLDEIENVKLNLMSYCVKQNEENFEVSQTVNTFYEKHNQIFSWLITAVESFIQGHQDMGGGLSMAQNFLQLHEQLSEDLRVRSSDVIEITESVPPHVLSRLPSNTKEDILQKLEMITGHWEYLKKTLEERIRLSAKYVRFHSSAVGLANELDSFDKSLAYATERSALPVRYDNIDELYAQLNTVAEEFLNELRQTQDSYLDVKRAQLCVETVLEHFANRKSGVEDKRTIWERSASDKKTGQALWKKNMVDSENTIDWVAKLESQLYPVLNGESVSAEVQIHLVNDKLNNIIPEIKRAQQEIQLRIRTAKELIAKGTLETSEQVPPKLNELYNDICTVIVEYTVFLEMFTAFLNNIKELEKKIDDLQALNDRVTETSSRQVNDLRVKHVAASKAFEDLWDITHTESQRIIDRIEHQEPVKYGEKDIRCINNLLQNKKSEWQDLSDALERKLKGWMISRQFDEDLESIHASIRELSEELSSLQHQYSLSLSAAKSSSVAFQYFEKTIQMLEGKIESFINTAEEVLEVNDTNSKEIESQLNQLKDRWNMFCAQVTETRRFIDLSIRYFTLIDETEECFREGTKLLVCVARKSSTARTPEEAEELLNNIKNFQISAQSKQEERINSISKLVSELFDDGEHGRQVNRIILENNDMLDSFSTVSKELAILQQKLKVSVDTKPVKEGVIATEVVSVEKLPSPLVVENVEVIHIIEENNSSFKGIDVVDASVRSPPIEKTKLSEELAQAQKPFFISPLKDGKIQEGSRFTFDCEVTGFPVPEITWLKDGLAIERNPDYQTTFANGVCKLRIEETFAEDSATFVCRASNEAGVAETSAVLKVVDNETISELQPPTFVIPIFDEIVRVGDRYEFHCKVAGNPLPDVQWYKNDVCVDSAPEFESTYNNGDAKLLIKNVTGDDNAVFCCVASNSLGTVKSSARLTVKVKSVVMEEPTFVTKLSNVMARAGQKLKLECQVTGKPFPTLSWTHNGKPLKDDSNTNVSVDDGGNVTLTIAEAFPKDAGIYTLTATNAAGESSCSGNISVKGLLPCETSDSEIPSDAEPVRPSIQTALKDGVVTEGSEALLECIIVGLPEPEVIWYHNNVPIKESKDVQLLFKGDKCTLLIKEVCREDEGDYKVIAINSAGESSSTALLKVQSSCVKTEDTEKEVEGVHPKFTKLLTDILAREGDTAVLECAVEGYPKPTIKWFLNKSEIEYSDRVKYEESPDGSVKLTVKNLQPEDKGLYTAVVRGQVRDIRTIH